MNKSNIKMMVIKQYKNKRKKVMEVKEFRYLGGLVIQDRRSKKKIKIKTKSKIK